MSLRARLVERIILPCQNDRQKYGEAEGSGDQADAEERGCLASIGGGLAKLGFVVNREVDRLEIFLIVGDNDLLLQFPRFFGLAFVGQFDRASCGMLS